MSDTTTGVKPPEGFSVVHAGDTKFEARGLRAFFEYRDLGIRGATKGRVGVHVIRARPGEDSTPQWHTHTVDFQMIYILKGWFKFEYEGYGEVTLHPGSCVHQPPGIRHREIAHSDDAELIEITLPAEFKTQTCDAP